MCLLTQTQGRYPHAARAAPGQNAAARHATPLDVVEVEREAVTR